MFVRRFLSAVLPGLLIATALLPQAALAEPLQFRITEGDVVNAFYQDGPVAAHLLLTSGVQPRALVAFPAGNSGVGIWFDAPTTAVQWHLDSVHALNTKDAQSRPLHGIEAEATLVAPSPLSIKDAVLGSVRVLRDYQLLHTYPDETAAKPVREGNTLTWARARLDGAPGYEIAVTVEQGQLDGGQGRPWTLRQDGTGKPLHLRLRALTGEKPLTPFAADALFTPKAGLDQRDRNALRFLSYREKFIAGSWRFDTYFGRDTLMSLRLLLPALQPQAVEDGLASVLDRLSPDGQVAHEEDIGEFAVLRHRKEHTSGDAPFYDYKMIDSDVMLAPVAAAYLLDSADGPARARAFLARKLDSGESAGAALQRNFALVLRYAQPFARDPVARNLLALKPNEKVGEWRDSETGLAGGRIPYDVNATLMPAALDAIARLQKAGLVAASTDAKDAMSPAQLASIWSRSAPPLFKVELPAAAARADVAKYAKAQGVDDAAALASLPAGGELTFNALSLDAQGKPIPVLNSDDGFALMFGHPDAAQLDMALAAIFRPFPAGLMTGVGMVVADSAYASGDIQQLLGRNAYHGAVVWSWQQALMAAGLARQLQRTDLPAPTMAALRKAQQQLWQVIHASGDMSTSELWSWNYVDGRYVARPFGQGKSDADESNAVQLWSTVYLAIPSPGADTTDH
ncbi:hypothetical protein [Rhodanobacter sp. DHG33]|uniref:hypothetical protein n=1 Tax=Rhodanobacter sp. DHG33 TaxID=2775921 RepID=UPI00178036F5|nr:hypothetical protein [Rhodanobacter sp. DHG33]MBD8899936.1 hypothetical protein [Rhodanobacter sp. DHG33]